MSRIFPITLGQISTSRPRLWTPAVASSGGFTYTNTKSIHLVTNKYVDFGNVLNFEFSDSFSLWGFIFPRSVTNHQGIFDKELSGPTFQGWDILQEATLKIRWQLTAFDGTFLDLTGSTAMTQNAWNFFCITYDGTRVPTSSLLYVNKATADTWTVNHNNLSNTSTCKSTQPARIGKSDANVTVFNGNVNQLGYAASVLAVNSGVSTLLDITKLLNGGTPGHAPDLTTYTNINSWWYLNEQDNTTSITDRKGTLTGTCNNIVAADFEANVP